MTDTGRVKEVFERALELHGEERGAFLDTACGKDANLRDAVDDLLSALDEAGEFMACPTEAGDPAKPSIDELTREGPIAGRYEILDRIGEGGMGTVYLAEQTEPVQRQVALKVVKLGMDTERVVQRFQAERQALAVMDHPNVAKVLDGGSTQSGRPFFVMELVDGLPLTEYCDAEQLDLRARLELFEHVCLAVEHAHLKGILHRDLKPSNVLVTELDGDAVPKVIDFGIAKVLDRTNGHSVTDVEQWIGTPEYMSPEQAAGDSAQVDTRSDVYALGVLLYELLAGARPFEGGESAHELMARIRETPVERPSTRFRTASDAVERCAALRRQSREQLHSALRGELDWIVLKALRKEPELRYQSARELGADVRRYLDDDVVQARPTSRGYALRKFARRHRLAIGAGGAVLVALVVGLAVALEGQSTARAAEAQARLGAKRVGTVLELMKRTLEAGHPQRGKGPGYTVRELLDDLDREAESLSTGDPKVRSMVHFWLGQAWTQLKEFDRAALHLDAALALDVQLEGRSGQDARTIRLQQAWLLHDRYDDRAAALSLFEEMLAELEADGEGESHLAAGAMMGLAASLVRTGRNEEAMELGERAIELERRWSGERSPNVASAIVNLANAYRGRGDYARCVEMLWPLLHWPERVGSARATDLNSLGVALVELRRFEEAEPLLDEAVELDQRLFGARHPHCATSLANRGTARSGLGELAGAESDLRAAYEINLATRREHHFTALSLNNLGIVVSKQGRHAEAAGLYSQAIEMYRDVLIEEHHHLAASIHNLGTQQLELGRFDRAEELLRAGHAMSARIHESAHPNKAWHLHTLARFLLDQRADPMSAEPVVREALRLREALLPAGSELTARSRALLARTLADLGRFDEALDAFRAACAALDATDRRERACLARAARARMLLAAGEADSADAESERAFVESREVRDRDTQRECLAARVRVLDALGRSEETLRAELWSTWERALPDPETAGTRDLSAYARDLADYGELLLGQGRAEEAREQLDRAVTTLDRALPAGHWRLHDGRSLRAAALAESDPTALERAVAELRASYEALEPPPGRAERKQLACERLAMFLERDGRDAEARELPCRK